MDSVTRNETVQVTREEIRTVYDVLREADELRMSALLTLGKVQHEHYKLEQLLLGLQKRFE